MKKLSIIIGLILFVGLFINPAQAATNLDTASLRVNLLNQDPDPAEPGKYVEIRLKAEKFGNNPLTNVNFYLETEYPLPLFLLYFFFVHPFPKTLTEACPQ